MNIDRNMLISYDTFNSCCTKPQKTAFFVMNSIKIPRNYNFTKMLMKIQYTCDLCVIWHYQPCDMYSPLHMIGVIGVTDLGIVTFHFAPNRRRFHWSISRWILLCRKHVFSKSLKSSLSLFVPSLRFFHHLANIIYIWKSITEMLIASPLWHADI